MAGVAGRLIGVMIGTDFISCEVSATLNLQQEMIPASPVGDGRWDHFVVGSRGWALSVNSNLLLQAVNADIKSILEANFFDTLPLTVKFTTDSANPNQLTLTGVALFKSADITSPSQGSATANVSLQGTGSLAATWQNYSLLINAMPPEMDWPLVVNSGFPTT